MTDSPVIIARTALPEEVLHVALEALGRGERVVMATVVARHGSAPSTPGQKLVLFDQKAIGTIGGGAVERVVVASMLRALGDPASVPRVETFRLGAALGMCCGGSVDILIEPMSPAISVWVIGAGHVGIFAAPLLASLGFRVTLCDAREQAADPARLVAVLPAPGARTEALPPLAAASATTSPVRLVHAEHDDPEVLGGFTRRLDEAAAVVMTHDHQIDQAAIEWALTKGFGFVGGVGSRAKAARTRARLQAKGVAEEHIARVRMPVGADIAARTPAEIAVAIAAELIAWRAKLRPSRHAGASAQEPALALSSTPALGAAHSEVDG